MVSPGAWWTNWNDQAAEDKNWAAAISDGSASQLSSPGSWWSGNDFTPQYTYGQRNSSMWGQDYAPSGWGLDYGAANAYSSSLISSTIDAWNRENHKELYEFSTDQFGNPVSSGRVSSKPGFGAFDTSADADIQAAASKYGVPPNFLKAIIARESSGRWGKGVDSDGKSYNNLEWIPSVRAGKPILGYIGFFEDSARRWLGPDYDLSTLNNNRAAQIDLLARAMAGLYMQAQQINPSYGWLNVAAMHFSGYWDITAYQDELGGDAGQYVRTVENWWRELDADAGNTWSNQSNINTNPSDSGTLSSPNTPKWAPINKFDDMINAAAQRWQVSPNFIKAVMGVENPNGDPAAGSPQGAVGLMQIMPFWNGTQGYNIYDPAQNIMLGAYILRSNYQQYGSWEMAAKAYIGLDGADANGNDAAKYWGMVKANWDELNGGVSYGANGAPIQTSQINAIFGGGAEPPISQGIETNDWTRAHPDMYDYGWEYGLNNGEHTGIDYAVPENTKLYAPGAGTVEIAGGSGYFQSDRYGGSPGTGELQIRLDNGHILILGHMNQVAVQLHQRVNAGDYVGLSGTAGSGPHVHVEYRIPAEGQTSSGWRIVDPRQYLGNAFAGVYQNNVQGAGISRPMTYLDLLKAGASGAPIIAGATISEGNTWNAWLQAATGLKGSLDAKGNVAGVTGTGYVNTSTTNTSGKPVTDPAGKDIVSLAQSYVHVAPYVWGGTAPSGWDCSGFVWYLYKNAWGMDIGTGSHQQFNGGTVVAPGNLQVGDLLFFDTANGQEWAEGNSASHVGMYIGNGQMVHAANPNDGTIITSITEPYYQSRFLGARRYR